ncbi:MAG: hypothetical protein RL154_1034 [Pseudomonadota bacterium]|jgi:lactam utilization protein B
MFGWKYDSNGKLQKQGLPNSLTESQKSMLNSVSINAKELKAKALKANKIRVGKIPF